MSLRPKTSTAAFLALAVALTACPKREEAGTADAGAAQANLDAGVAAPRTADAAVAADAGAKAKGANKTRPALTPAERKTVLAALDAGRKKVRAKDTKGALADFDRALAIAPDDGRVLAEVGYAAMLAGDLARAESANKRALANVHDKQLRAQVLYNAGRVAEERKNPAAARAAYAESLGLRENAEVRKRLAAAGGALPFEMPCAAGAPTPEALCPCLLASDLLFLGKPSECRVIPESLAMGTPRLSVLRVGTDSESDVHFVLIARDGGTVRPVADLGSIYEPGAFGVHNTATVGKGEVRTFGKRSVVVVTSVQDNFDQNLAGLEICTEHEDMETVCALGEGSRPTRCVTVTVLSEGGCGPGVEPDDEESKAMVAERKAGWGPRTTAKTTWRLADDGSLEVRPETGPTTNYTLF